MHPDSQPPHILVVNDSPGILSLQREIFEEEGFRVTTLITSETHLDEIIYLAQDLVILNYSTEAESHLLQHLTDGAPFDHIPVVLCTGAVRQIEAIRPHLDAIGVGIVYKPFEIEHLLDVVREKLGLGSDPKESLPPRSE